MDGSGFFGISRAERARIFRRDGKWKRAKKHGTEHEAKGNDCFAGKVSNEGWVFEYLLYNKWLKE